MPTNFLSVSILACDRSLSDSRSEKHCMQMHIIQPGIMRDDLAGHEHERLQEKLDLSEGQRFCPIRKKQHVHGKANNV